jgi:hypothetical protein
MLLLVDDQQPEVAELRIAEQRMGADDDVDGARLDPLAHRIDLLARHQPRDLRDVHRIAVEAFAERGVVLARQQRGGHDDRHLLARHDRDEGGAQRHFGLAEADVAAHQPVHRPAGLQVLQRRLDGASWSSVSSKGKRAQNSSNSPCGGLRTSAVFSARSAAVRISSSAISCTRFLSRPCAPARRRRPAGRAGLPIPPSRSGSDSSRFSTGRNSRSLPA